MRTFAVLGVTALSSLTASRALLAEDFRFENPLAGKDYIATFSRSTNPKSKAEATVISIKDKSGTTILEKELPKQDAQSARWTDDGKFLLITARNSEGHSPWRYAVYVYSANAREVRSRSDENEPPCISSGIWCQPPDKVILVGHTFEHKIPAPDDPILLRYEMNKLWPTLQKL